MKILIYIVCLKKKVFVECNDFKISFVIMVIIILIIN